MDTCLENHNAVRPNRKRNFAPPPANAVPMKTWLMNEAERLGTTYRALHERIRRGLHPRPAVFYGGRARAQYVLVDPTAETATIRRCMHVIPANHEKARRQCPYAATHGNYCSRHRNRDKLRRWIEREILRRQAGIDRLKKRLAELT